MSNKEIADTLKALPEKLVIADSAEPKSIDEIRAYGLNIQPAKKGKDSVRSGIQLIQDQPISITKQSVNGIREYRNYLWMVDKEGRILNEPEKGNDHFLDATRYAFETLGRIKQEVGYWDRIWKDELTGHPVKKQFNKGL
jgi:phage terminase large subunit